MRSHHGKPERIAVPVPSWRRLRLPVLAAVAFALALTGCGIGTRATPPMADSATPGPVGVSTFLLRLNAATMPQ